MRSVSTQTAGAAALLLAVLTAPAIYADDPFSAPQAKISPPAGIATSPDEPTISAQHVPVLRHGGVSSVRPARVSVSPSAAAPTPSSKRLFFDLLRHWVQAHFRVPPID